MTRHRSNRFMPCFGMLLVASFIFVGPPVFAAAAGDDKCEIEGPTTVLLGESFTLCGPSGQSRYEWSGSGIRGSSETRCIEVRGLEPGTHRFTLETRTRDGKNASRTCTIRVNVVGARASCVITGPDTVDANTSFQLCGKSLDNARYHWRGPGIQADSGRRCVTIEGLAPGQYTFALTVTRATDTTACNYSVTVLTPLNCPTITGPAFVTAGTSFELCVPAVDGATYSWSGNGIQSGASTRCVTIRSVRSGTNTYTLTYRRNGQNAQCTFAVQVNEAALTCAIVGPGIVATDSSFKLCGPEGSGLGWSWSGPAIDGERDERCIRVRGLERGTHVFSLAVTRNNATQTCTLTVEAVSRTEDPRCHITGPSTVGNGSTFTLCGPGGSDFEFLWAGPGVQDSQRTSRCVTIADLRPGQHTFTLRVNDGNVERTCTHIVNVTMAETGSECPRPMSYWDRQCDGDDDRRSDDYDQEALRNLAQCIDDRSSAFTWSQDLSSFCKLLGASSKSNRKTWVRQQFAVLLANVCAWESDVPDRNGNRFGIDPASRLTCDVLGSGTVGELIPRVEGLLARTGNSKTVREVWKELHSVARCLAGINRGSGLGGRCGSRDDDGDDDDRTMPVDSEPSPAELAPDADEVDASQVTRFAPNPFRASTRMEFVVRNGGEQVRIGIYDLAGRLIQQLANGPMEVGVHNLHWNGTDSQGDRVGLGIYFVRGHVGTQPISLRVMYLR